MSHKYLEDGEQEAREPTAQAPSIGVLVTNYNSWALALKCTRASLDLCPALRRVVLLDDCSPDAPDAASSGEIARLELEPRFALERNEKNMGFAATLNKGVRLLDADIVLVFDADAYPLSDYAAEVAREFSADPRLGLLGFGAVDEEGRPTPSAEPEPSALSLLLGQKLYAAYQARFERGEGRLCLYTFALAIRKEAFEELGGFDEELDWLDVDLEMSMKANRSSWKVKASTTLRAFHTGGGTPMLVSNRVLKFYQNRWKLLRKFGKIRRPHTARALILGRLSCEMLLLRALGQAVFRDPAVYRDKIQGRQAIIRHCRRSYR